MFELFDFNITINSSLPEDIAFYIDNNNININEVLNVLNKDCKMDYILLCSNYNKQTYKVIDVRGLSNAEVCEKVYAFYKHKTYRRLMGNHIWLEGWFHPLPDEPNVFKPLMYGS